MFSPLSILITVVPMGLVLAGAALVRKRGSPEKADKRSFMFLTWTVLGLLALARLMLAAASSGGYGYSLTLAPVTAGTAALALLHAREWARLQKRERNPILAGLILLTLAASLQFFLARSAGSSAQSDELIYGGAILAIAVLPALVWKAGRAASAWVAMGALLYMLVFNLLEGGALPLFGGSTGIWLSVVGSAIYLLLPAYVIVTAAMLTWKALRPGVVGALRAPGPARASRLLLVIGLLAAFSYTVVWMCIWDGTDDGIRGLIMLMVSTLAASACGMVLVMLSTGWRRWSGPVFAILVMGLVYWTLMVPGNRYRPYEITENRAASLQQALERFRAENLTYPQELEELTPGVVWRIPRPMIIPGQGWCYEGGRDYYRLGTIYRDHWSSPSLSVRVYASAGTRPGDSWICDERLREMTTQLDLQNNAPPTPIPLPTSVVAAKRSRIGPILHAPSLSMGGWSADGSTLVFGSTVYSVTEGREVEIDLRFLDAKTGQICAAAQSHWKGGQRSDGLNGQYAWLMDGRLLYLSGAGDMVAMRPCEQEVEDLAARFPVQFTQVAASEASSGRALLMNPSGYWLLEEATLEVKQVQGITPKSPEIWSDRATWLEGGERLALTQVNGQGAGEGSMIYILNGANGAIERSLPIPAEAGQVDPPFVDWLTREQLLVQNGSALSVLDLRSDPPKTTDLIRDVFLLDLSYPLDFASMDFITDPDGESYEVGVRVNQPNNQDGYVYDSATGQVSVFQHDISSLIFFPENRWMRLLKLDEPGAAKDAYEMVWMDRPLEEKRLIVEGHSPRQQSPLIPHYLPGSSQLVFNSSQGISLVSIPDGKTIRFWELAEAAGQPTRVYAAPSGEALVVVAAWVGLYYIALP